MDNFNVLVVDDNENNRFSAKAVLSQLQLSIFEAENGSEALSCLIREDINLIILDIQLPDYDGFEIAKIIKSRKATMTIPIIFATAIYKTEAFIEKGYTLGALDYIMKPFNTTMLLSKVKYYMRVHVEKNKLIDSLKEKNRELEENYKRLKELEHDIQLSETNWRLLGENIPYLVEVYDKNMKITFDNHVNINGDLSKIHEDHQDQLIEQIDNTMKSGDKITEVYILNDKDKVKYCEVASFLLWVQSENNCMVIVRDVTNQHEYEESIVYMGYHDQLTGLRNRHFFRKYMENLDIKGKLPLSIIMGDVNGLKMINDSFGHAAGDELIKKSAKAILSNIGKEGVVARWGGDEFIALIPKADESRVEEILRDISLDVFNEKVDDRFPLSIALGEATRYEDTFSFEEMIKEAEDKMYVNKMKSQLSYRSTVIDSLKGAMFERDYETEEHTERISQMALLMADKLGLTQNDKDKLVLLGDLHDIGKIAIPTHVLNSVKPLTDMEWSSIKRHPEIGYRICSAVPELSSISELVLSHHERWDGKGYPRGLKETEIPLLARLICILDAFDVMTHDRPYKKRKSLEWAVEEVSNCSGTQFDPNLVAVFKSIVSEKGFRVED